VNGRLERLEDGIGAEQEGPWWSLPPCKEPYWPKPLGDWAEEEVEVLSHRDKKEYCNALNEGRNYSPIYEEVWLNQEMFHDSRWRKYGITRHSSEMPPPKAGCIDEYAEEKGEYKY